MDTPQNSQQLGHPISPSAPTVNYVCNAKTTLTCRKCKQTPCPFQMHTNAGFLVFSKTGGKKKPLNEKPRCNGINVEAFFPFNHSPSRKALTPSLSLSHTYTYTHTHTQETTMIKRGAGSSNFRHYQSSGQALAAHTFFWLEPVCPNQADHPTSAPPARPPSLLSVHLFTSTHRKARPTRSSLFVSLGKHET